MELKGLLAFTLCLCLSTAGGARLPSVDDVYDFIQSNLLHAQDYATPGDQSGFGMGPGDPAWLADSMTMSMIGSAPHWGPVHMVANFFVRPSLHREFLEEWHRFQDCARKQKSVTYINLYKPIKDNLAFTAYVIISDMGRFHEGMRHDGFIRFFRFIMDHDIALVRDVLLPVGCGCPHCHKNAENSAEADTEDQPCTAADNVEDAFFNESEEPVMGDAEDRGPHGPPRIMRLVTSFNVPPGAGGQFIKAWRKLASEVREWKGSKAFGLARVLGDNTKFVGFAAFKPPKGGPPRKERDAFEKYMEHIEDLGVSFTTTPVFRVGDMPHHR